MKKIFMNLLLQKVGCENAQGCQLVTAAINIKSIEHFFSSFLDMLLNICQRWNDEDDNAQGFPDEQNFSRKKLNANQNDDDHDNSGKKLQLQWQWKW